MTENELRAWMNTTENATSRKVQQALIDVIIRGKKWREAAIAHGCTESGICRAMKRLGIKSTRVDNG